MSDYIERLIDSGTCFGRKWTIGTGILQIVLHCVAIVVMGFLHGSALPTWCLNRHDTSPLDHGDLVGLTYQAIIAVVHLILGAMLIWAERTNSLGLLVTAIWVGVGITFACNIGQLVVAESFPATCSTVVTVLMCLDNVGIVVVVERLCHIYRTRDRRDPEI